MRTGGSKIQKGKYREIKGLRKKTEEKERIRTEKQNGDTNVGTVKLGMKKWNRKKTMKYKIKKKMTCLVAVMVVSISPEQIFINRG